MQYFQKLFSKRLWNQRGISLLEAVLGVMLMGFAFAGAMPIFNHATAKATKTDHFTAATYYANEKLENIMADKEFQGFDSISDDNYAAETIPGTNYFRSVAVTEVNSNDLSTEEAGSGYKKVVVTVVWGEGQNEQISVTTLLTNY